MILIISYRFKSILIFTIDNILIKLVNIIALTIVHNVPLLALYYLLFIFFL